MSLENFGIDEKSTGTIYPKSIFFIISNEFCERFNYYGLRTILVLYLTRKLGYDDDSATVLFHIFSSLVYFCPLIGAIIADSWLGKFKTIFYLSIVYCIGTLIIAAGAVPPLQLPAQGVTILGLILIAIGTGGIKPCVSAFGGDQFKIPEQTKQLATFFSLFYFAINAGSLISTTLTPILREDVRCFGENGCFSLAFGVPAILMLLSVVIFVAGKKLYQIRKPSGNMIVSVSKCIANAITVRAKEKKSNPREHWLDYAEQKHDRKLISDTRGLLKVLVLFLPLPVFWALFDQQGSRWTFQATRMVGEIGGGISIKPDQMQVINPLLILIFIPLFDYVVYPLLSKVGIKRPLQKLTLGGLMAAVAFILSGFVEFSLEKTYPLLPGPGESQIRIFNGLSCEYNFISDHPNIQMFHIPAMEVFEHKHLKVEADKSYNFEGIPANTTACTTFRGKFNLKAESAWSYFMTLQNDTEYVYEFKEYPDKPKNTIPYLRILANLRNQNKTIVLNGHSQNLSLSTNNSELQEVTIGHYHIFLDEKQNGILDVQIGGVYTILITEDDRGGYHIRTHTITQPNSVSMAWQLPQIIIMTAGEIMFSVTGLEFSFTQAPPSMRSVLQACWLLTVAFGNVIVVIIAEFKLFKSQAYEFFLFAGLMIFDMLIFMLLAYRYTYVQHSEKEENVFLKPVGHDGTENTNAKPSGVSNSGYVGD